MPQNNEVCGSSYVEHHLRTLSLSVPPYNYSNVSCINWFTRDQRPLQVAFFFFFSFNVRNIKLFPEIKCLCSLVNRSLFRSLFYKALMSGVEESRFFDDQYRPCKRFKPGVSSRSSMIFRVNVVLKRTVVVDNCWRFDNLSGSHL